jgi:hypothetical protein
MNLQVSIMPGSTLQFQWDSSHLRLMIRKKRLYFTRPAFRTEKFCAILTPCVAVQKNFARDRANF